MAVLDHIELPNGITYDISDASARKLDNNDFDTINVTELNAGDVIVTGAARFLNTINGDISGNAETATSATKATQDESGNNIKSTYANAINISDHTITLKNKNGASLGTVTVPDNNTTYTVATGTANGKIKVTPSSGSAYEVSVYGLKSAAYKDVTDSYSATGTDPVSGKAVAAALDSLPEPMVFKGSLGTGGTITALPVDGTAKVGDTYKVITAGTYASKAAKVGDTFICLTKTSSANTWELIPSGDEPSGTVTSVAISNGGGLSVSGSPITSSGTITISHADTSSQASVNNSGRTYIQDITLDTYGHVTGITSATETVVNTDRYVNSATFADATSADANNPVKMTLTRAGSDTASVTAYLPKVSSSSAGVAPKGTAVSSQSQSTKFLREDGTWAAPSYTTNTNTTYSLSASSESVVLTGSDSSSKSVSLSTLINGLSEGASPATSGDYIIAQYAGGGTTTKTYHRRKLSNIFKAMSSNDITTALGYTPPHEPVLDIPNTPTPIATFSGASNLPLSSLKVTVTPYQDLHGYDAPWAGGAGKNKLEVTATSQTINGVTFTVNDDGTVLVNGTASDITVFIINNISNLGLTDGTQYILSGCSDGTSSTYKLDILKDNGSPEVINLNGDTTFTKSTILNREIRIVVYSGVTVNNIVFKPMIRLATVSDATFAPYSNICPISGWTEVDVTRCGKNLLDPTIRKYSKPFVVYGGTIASNVPDGSLVLTAGTYTISINKNMSIIEVRDNPNSIIKTGQGNSLTFTLEEEKAIKIAINIGSADIDSLTFQLERGSTATTYEPYNGQTYTIDLDGTRYGGELDVVSGVLTLTHGYIASYNGETLPSTWISDRDVYAEGTMPTVGAQVVYKLATPLTIQLTPTQVKSLEGENNIFANCGQITEVKYVVQDYSDITSKISEFAQLATTASKLGSSNIGSATQPIFLSAGTATACTYTLGKSVPSNAVFTDTKNTAGSTDTSSKLFLIGATSQTASSQTYSQDTAYVGTDGCLYSGANKVLTEADSSKFAGNITCNNGTINVAMSTTSDSPTDYILNVQPWLVSDYGVCDTAAATAAKVVSVTNSSFYLTSGVTVRIKFDYANTASAPTLNVNGTGAKNIVKWGTTAVGTSTSTSWTAGSIVSFTYDGTSWVMNDHIDDTNDSVTQTATNGSYGGAFPILLSNSSNTDTETSSVLKAHALSYRPQAGVVVLGGDSNYIAIAKGDINFGGTSSTTWDGTNTSLKSALAGKVSKTGDTMTGELIVQNHEITLKNTSVDLTLANNGITTNIDRYYRWYDNNNKYSGYIGNIVFTDGTVQTQFYTRNYKTDDTTNVDNGISLSVKKDGTRSVYVSDAVAWRSALGLGSAATHGVYDKITQGHFDWDDHKTELVTNAAICFWNGRYNSGSSNLQYCDRGRFGTIVTKSTDDYVAATGDTMTGALTVQDHNIWATQSNANTEAQLGVKNTGSGGSSLYFFCKANRAGIYSTYGTTVIGIDNNKKIDINGTEYSIANAAAFRNALLLGNPGTINYEGSSSHIYIRVNNTASSCTKISQGQVKIVKWGCIVMIKLTNVKIPTITARSDIYKSSTISDHMLTSDAYRPPTETGSFNGTFLVETDGAIRIDSSQSGKSIYDSVVFIAKKW